MNTYRWGILGFALAGTAIAAYLTYTHLAHVAPVCAGMGDCAIVQASSYATLFGIPVALFGLLAYLAILASLAVSVITIDPDRALLARQLTFGIALAGTLYSAYLTYVEAFVLHAYCVYCVTSAICVTAILILAGVDLFKESEA